MKRDYRSKYKGLNAKELISQLADLYRQYNKYFVQVGGDEIAEKYYKEILYIEYTKLKIR